MSLLYSSTPMIFVVRMKREKIPGIESSSWTDSTSTFGVFCTRLRAMRRTRPAVSPELMLGRSGRGLMTSPSASFSSLSYSPTRWSISDLYLVYMPVIAAPCWLMPRTSRQPSRGSS